MQVPYHCSAIAALLVVLFTSTSRITLTTAYQVTPNGSSDAPPPISTNGKGLFIEEQYSAHSRIESLAAKSFQCTQATSKRAMDYEAALDDLLAHWDPPSGESSQAFGCLFVGPVFASYLESLVQHAQGKLGEQTQLLTVVGGGVIGDGQETEDSCGLSFIGGVLPDDSSVKLFSWTDGSHKNDSNDDFSDLKSRYRGSLSPSLEDRKPSHLVFADPHCHEIHSVMEQIDGIVAGGISVAAPSHSSLAIGTHVLPPGSLIGATFSGNVGLQVVVTQGCRPVGSTFRVTSVDGPAIHELDGERALDQLQAIMNQVMKEDETADVPTNVQSDDFLGGIHKDEDGIFENGAHDERPPHDFILRQMTGFRPRSGSILVCGPQIHEGDYFRFHVQSKEIALEDWRRTLERAGTERLFLGGRAGRALGALQISCMGRGQSLFGIPNVDLRHGEQLLPPNTPIAGLMANAEIGPVGIRMGSTSETCRSVLHGFASVVAMLCDYSDTEVESTTTSALGNSTDIGAWD